MTSQKLNSSVAPKIKGQHYINHLLCMNLCPGCSANYVGKTERTLFERNVEHASSGKDSVVNIHLNECNDVQHMFKIALLAPPLFSDSIVDDIHDPRMSRINLAQMNTRIIHHHKD